MIKVCSKQKISRLVFKLVNLSGETEQFKKTCQSVTQDLNSVGIDQFIYNGMQRPEQQKCRMRHVMSLEKKTCYQTTDPKATSFLTQCSRFRIAFPADEQRCRYNVRMMKSCSLFVFFVLLLRLVKKERTMHEVMRTEVRQVPAST